MLVIIMLVIWTTSGTFMLMFLAGLQTVPDEVHEAAAIDGATGGRPSDRSRCRCCAATWCSWSRSG